MLEFIRSLHEGNNLYVDESTCPLVFVLDCVHYARWIPIHIQDMNALGVTHPSMYGEFQNGNFVVQRFTHHFPCMSMDQSYEQLKKSIKGDGGAVGLTENLKELSRIVAEFEDTVCDVSESVMSAKQLGIKQYNAFITNTMPLELLATVIQP